MQDDRTQSNYQIAVITYIYADNYGSVLQGYALVSALKEMGYDAFFIDYKKKEVIDLYRIFKPLASKYNILTDCYHLLHYFQLQKKRALFQEFRNRFLPKSHYCYETFDSLTGNVPKADCYICGSDQVWNTGIVDFDSHYLLDFVKDQKKISYAASGITPETPEEDIEAIAGLIHSFSSVSVRETIAKKRLERACDIEIECVVDPVALLSAQEWERIIPDSATKLPYIFCYFAGGVSKAFDQYTKNLAKMLGLKRILIMPEWRNASRSGTKKYDCGPIEFLSYIRSAALVCTNSFHGTVFSVIFNRPFIVGLHKPFTEERIRTFLSMCQLENREIDPQVEALNERVLDIDFSVANKMMRDAADKSKRWLRSAIEGGVL